MKSGLLTLLMLALLIQHPVPARAKNDIFGAIAEVNISRFIGSGTVVDLDNDGDLDLVSDDYFISDQDFPMERGDRFLNTYIVWFENNGRQYYTIHVMGRMDASAASIFIADLDADGDLDVIARARDRSLQTNLVWFENDGHQNFDQQTISVTPGVNIVYRGGAQGLGVGDLDGDGDIDLLTALDTEQRMVWLENDGSQNFLLHTISSTSTDVRAVDIADFDGDGDLDAVSLSQHDGTISWYRNDGRGAFSEQVISTTLAGAYGLAVGDINGDGSVDLLVSGLPFGPEYDSTIIGWYRNDGTAGFTFHTIIHTSDQVVALERAPATVWLSDFDGDGDVDVLAQRVGYSSFFGFSGLSGELTWYENDGQQNFAAHTAVEGGFAAYTIADIDSDGDVDLIRNATLFENDGQQNFVPRIETPALGVGKLIATDLDADGDFDIVSGPEPSRNGSLIWHQRFAEDLFDSQLIGEGKAPVVADMNQDGIPDVVYLLNGPGWYEFDGRDGFTQHIIDHNLQFVDSVFAVDLDGDGDTDILTNAAVSFPGETSHQGVILWYENDGQQRFQKRQVNAKRNAPGSVDPRHLYRAVVAADMDGDGDMDVLSASALDNTISWHENNGHQSFTERTITTSAPYPFALVASDIDGDGDTDVLASTRDNGGIAWYENVGQNHFIVHSITTGHTSEIRFLALDIDADGDLDVLASFKADDTVAWFENDGQQGFTRHLISDSTRDATGIAAADLDGDGNTDVVSAAQRSAKIQWHKNTQVYRGLAFDPARNGHGYEFQKRVDNSFLLFFTYDDEGNPEWLFGVGDFDNGRFTIPEGSLNRFTYDPANRSPITLPGNGSASIDFNISADDPACTASGISRANSKQIARFEWKIDGESGAWCSQLLLFGESPSDPNLGGAWFAGEADNGWGLSISTQGDQIVAILYYYDANGTGRWAWGNASFVPGQDVSLEMLQFKGYCRTCELVELESEIAGRLDLKLSEPDLDANGGNRATVNVRYLGADGGSWERIDAPIRLLSDPATASFPIEPNQ